MTLSSTDFLVRVTLQTGWNPHNQDLLMNPSLSFILVLIRMAAGGGRVVRRMLLALSAAIAANAA